MNSKTAPFGWEERLDRLPQFPVGFEYEMCVRDRTSSVYAQVRVHDFNKSIPISGSYYNGSHNAFLAFEHYEGAKGAAGIGKEYPSKLQDEFPDGDRGNGVDVFVGYPPHPEVTEQHEVDPFVTNSAVIHDKAE